MSRERAPRTPNQALRFLLSEAGWSGARLAREVNALGAEQGTPLSYDRTSVAHWLAGSRPRRPVPALVAEALSRRLGRAVRVADTGLEGAEGVLRGPAGPGAGSAVERLDGALRTAGRHRAALSGAYSLAALDCPAGDGRGDRGHQGGRGDRDDRDDQGHRGDQDAAPRPSGIRSTPHRASDFPEPPPRAPSGTPEAPPAVAGGGRRTGGPEQEPSGAPGFEGPSPAPPGRVDRGHVESANELLAFFSRGDAVLGAGPVYEPLRLYLFETVLPWLTCDMGPAVRRELFAVASRLTYLCAFTHFDMNRQAAAQRLYLTSADLAREAGDRVGYGLALRGLSVQAHALGHFAEARQLAERAAEAALRHAPPHKQAFLHGQLAVTLAGSGDARYARHLAAADRCLDRSPHGDTPVGAFHPGSLALQRATVATSLGDQHTAARELALSLRHRPADERRSRALSLAELAEMQLAVGHLEQACRTWHTFLDVYPHISSARADDRVRLLTAKARPYSGTPAVAALLGRVREVAAARGTRGGRRPAPRGPAP
ncbi:hypothetical protein B7C62_10410 [Kitasatospora albolonga]|uniref:Transcriptional regulator n=1 Tax=Kitasatospora albolonga TaxID=68173 RepID=A0ABC8BR33_9ACTN|nr:hypothetical protein B7C62_10410 [Kitasatospora albolonga]